MPANRFNGYTDLGIGIGLRIPHYAHILSKKPTVDWFEIISENYMCDAGRPLEVLDDILQQYQIIQHGVALYFGSTDPIDREQLKRLKTLVKRTKTPFLSDHLCWGSVDGTYTHDLLPTPYTFACAKNTAKRIREVRDFLEIPLIVENVSSYAEFHASEMTEWQFLTEVVERADCGILLDVNNIYVSSKNHGFDPYEYLNNVPHDRVGQIHIAGHTKYEKYILDTHDHPVLDPVWKMYAHAIRKCGPTSTLLEWDANIPSFEEVHREALKAKKFLDAVRDKKDDAELAVVEMQRVKVPKKRRQTLSELRQLQRLAGAVIMRPLSPRWRMQKKWIDNRDMREVTAEFIKPNDRLTSFERIEIYNKQYWFRLIDTFYDDFPGLRAILGRLKFNRLAKDYIAAHPSTSYTMRNLGRFLPGFIEKNPRLVQPRFKLALEMARFEWSQVEAFDGKSLPPLTVDNLLGKDPAKLRLALQPYVSVLELHYPLDEYILRLKKSVDRGGASNAFEEISPEKSKPKRRPPIPREKETFVVVHRLDNVLYYKRIDRRAFRLLASLDRGATLGKALKVAFANEPDAELIREWFQTWTELEWFCKKSR